MAYIEEVVYPPAGVCPLGRAFERVLSVVVRASILAQPRHRRGHQRRRPGVQRRLDDRCEAGLVPIQQHRFPFHGSRLAVAKRLDRIV